ncbi:MAG: hypothetical protein AAF585_03040 [Verrucomicrobiota bacterium]
MIRRCCCDLKRALGVHFGRSWSYVRRSLVPLWVFGLAFAASAETVGFERPAEETLIDQHIFSAKACGPTAALTVLKVAHPDVFQQLPGANDETRLRYVTDRYFRKPSSNDPKRPRYTNISGVSHEDMANVMREMAEEHDLPAIRSGELVRGADESSREMVFRVHRILRSSLNAKTPPIIALRSQVAVYDEAAEKWGWERMADHFVIVLTVPDRLDEGELGFAFDYIDPNGGLMATGFIYAERKHAFAGFQGSEDNGQWLGGNRFLVVAAPRSYSLIDEDQAEWQVRAVTILSYFVGS